MIELSRAQHLDVIKALSESVDGSFRLLNNEIPAYKNREGKWVEMHENADVNAYKVAKDLGLKISKLPLDVDNLGGIALIKDFKKMSQVITSAQVQEPDFRFMTAYQQALLVKKALDESGAITPFSDFPSALESIYKHTSHAGSVVLSLKNSPQLVVWKEHHKRLSSTQIPESELDRSTIVPTVKNKKILESALILAAKNHYQRPELFINTVHSELFNRNIALTFANEPGDVNELSPPMKLYLEEVLKAYSGDTKALFEKVSVPLVLEYRPLNQDLRALGVTDGLRMIRDVLKNGQNKKAAEVGDVTDKVEPPRNNDTLLSMAVRLKVWSWRTVLNSVTNDLTSEQAEKVNSRWSEVLNENPLSIGASFEDLKLTLSRVEKIYGPLVERSATTMKSDLYSRVLNHPELNEMNLQPVRDALKDIMDKITNTSKSDVLSSYISPFSLNEVIDDKYIRSAKNNFLANKSLPGMLDFKHNYDEKVTKKFKPEAEPEPVSWKAKI